MSDRVDDFTTPIEEPHNNDVLCGRGGHITYWPGNTQLRNDVKERQWEYLDCSKTKKKQSIVSEIIEKGHLMKPRRRFLAKLRADGALWYQVSNERAVDKIKQLFRENAPLLRMQKRARPDETVDMHNGRANKIARTMSEDINLLDSFQVFPDIFNDPECVAILNCEEKPKKDCESTPDPFLNSSTATIMSPQGAPKVCTGKVNIVSPEGKDEAQGGTHDFGTIPLNLFDPLELEGSLVKGHTTVKGEETTKARELLSVNMGIPDLVTEAFGYPKPQTTDWSLYPSDKEVEESLQKVFDTTDIAQV